MSSRKLGGAVDLLAVRDTFAPVASLGNPRGKNGGFTKSPLAGALLGTRQLNNLNTPKNDTVDPLDRELDAQDLLVTALPPASIIAITVAELATHDPGGGGASDGSGGGGDTGGTGDGGADGSGTGGDTGGDSGPGGPSGDGGNY